MTSTRTQLRAALSLGALLVLCSASLVAQTQKSAVNRFSRNLPFEASGSISIENPVGSVVVTGVDAPGGASFTIETVVHGVDDDALREGLAATKVLFGGNRTNLLVSTKGFPSLRTAKWHTVVNYNVRVPSTVNVRVVAPQSPLLRVHNVSGNVHINHVTGLVNLQSVSGPTNVDTINGNIVAFFSARPQTNVRLSSINGTVDVIVPPTSAFEWIAETLKGEIMTPFPLRGAFAANHDGKLFRGTLNDGRAPQIRVTSITNRVYLLPIGGSRLLARAIRPAQSQIAGATPAAPARPVQEDIRATYRRVAQSLLLAPPSAKTFTLQRNAATGDVDFSTLIGNVFVGEITGNARISTQAGEIVLGRVRGTCDISSLGGPLNLGDVGGQLNARTAAGDILVRAARDGGFAMTDGGSIQILFAGAPIQLQSGGGDISVRNAASNVKADTRKGDITLYLPRAKSPRAVGATTVGGNIVLHVAKNVGFEVDATILTSPGSEHRFDSNLTGLNIVREQAGNRVRIRATGKVGGGGDRLELRTEDGNIQIRADL